MEFILSQATRVAAQWNSVPVQHAIRRFNRDLHRALSPSNITPNNDIVICLAPNLPTEGYTIDIQDDRSMIICAADDLAAVYALLYLSQEYLGVEPFWFWNDQTFDPQPLSAVTQAHIVSTPAAVAYRGWVLDDEPMLDAWAGEENQGWEMAFEALLRCGGNLVLAAPGPCSDLAADMGLWLAQNHAEPLGALPFAAVYPSLTPTWPAQSDAYRALWGEAVRRQKVHKTVWSVGFRGQNGQPFWADDASCVTMEQRGKRLSTILTLQYDIVRTAAPHAPVCTALVGEEAALYRAGVLDLPQDIILLWPDAGCGRCLPKGQPPALPDRGDKGEHGIVYRLGGHDRQGANNLTLWPEAITRVQQDLCECYRHGVKDLWLLGAPNLKPHLYPLDLAAALWRSTDTDPAVHRTNYLRTYYRAPDGWTLSDSALDDLVTCVKAWADSTAVLPGPPARRMGEEFMTYGTRAFAAAWLCGQMRSSVPAMRWLAGDRPFGEQLTRYREACVAALPRFETLAAGCEYARRATTRLWQDTVQLQVRLYLMCLRGAVRFCDACALFIKQDYRACFLLLGQAAGDYAAATAALEGAGHDVWANFYSNDCRADCQAATAALYHLMALARAAGDPEDTWQQAALGDGWQRCPRLDEAGLYQALQGAVAE